MKVLDVPSSGSVNWRTASRNRNGQYIRNRSIPVQPRSSAQLAVRGFLILAAQAWKNLSTDDQMAWKTFGSLHPRTDSLGQSNAPTGEQAFVSACCVSQLLGGGLLSGPPPAEPDLSAFVEGTLSSAGGVTQITGYTNPSGGQIMVWAAKPTSSGRRFFGQPLYLQASVLGSSAAIDISAQLAARWGTPANGSLLQIRQVPTKDGILGGPQVSQVIIGSGTPHAAPVVTTNFTLTSGSGTITYHVITATLPSGVTYFQFQWKLTAESVWTIGTPVHFVPDNGWMSGALDTGMPAEAHDIELRWYAGTIPGLPSSWSTVQHVTPS